MSSLSCRLRETDHSTCLGVGVSWQDWGVEGGGEPATMVDDMPAARHKGQHESSRVPTGCSSRSSRGMRRSRASLEPGMAATKPGQSWTWAASTRVCMRDCGPRPPPSMGRSPATGSGAGCWPATRAEGRGGQLHRTGWGAGPAFVASCMGGHGKSPCRPGCPSPTPPVCKGAPDTFA